MKFFKFILISILIIPLSATTLSAESNKVMNPSNDAASDEKDSLRTTVITRFLKQNKRFGLTKCNKNPRICSIRGSPGPVCCKKRCVNLVNDRLNCGKCGHKCKFSEICCQGKCVNPLRHEKHCGRCNNQCKGGSSCAFGICSYAD